MGFSLIGLAKPAMPFKMSSDYAIENQAKESLKSAFPQMVCMR
jgi:hypothetical protein